jgi:hypothetical protein
MFGAESGCWQKNYGRIVSLPSREFVDERSPAFAKLRGADSLSVNPKLPGLVKCLYIHV